MKGGSHHSYNMGISTIWSSTILFIMTLPLFLFRRPLILQYSPSTNWTSFCLAFYKGLGGNKVKRGECWHRGRIILPYRSLAVMIGVGCKIDMVMSAHITTIIILPSSSIWQRSRILCPAFPGLGWDDLTLNSSLMISNEIPIITISRMLTKRIENNDHQKR